MILNGLGLGFVSAPLYLFRRFFVGTATEHLIGEGVEPEHLNDDRLARALDELWEQGLTSLFTRIAMLAQQRFEIKTQSLHLDSTSFSVEGNYQSDPSQAVEAVKITYGYSKDHRQDLKQFLMDIICSRDGDVTLFVRIADGNGADRVAALAMVMGLCLLIYTLGQRQLRQALAEQGATVPIN